MDDDQEEQERERPRPRVVDKRVSARREEGTSPPTPEPAATEGVVVEPPRHQEPLGPPPGEPRQAAPQGPEGPGQGAGVWTPQQEEQAKRLAEELARAPGRDLVVTFAMNFVEVASVKLEAGDLEGAQLAIDAFDGILRALGPRLGDAEGSLKSVLAQLQMGYAQRAAGIGN
jgi:hypothetical protein